MDLIYQYVWFVVGGAAFLAFLIGLILRGMLSAGKNRRATVERDVAITELEQVRGELDSLYAAQRKQREAAAASSGVSTEEIEERDRRLANLSTELDSARNEIQSLRQARDAKSAEPAPVADSAAEELAARNTFLEERVAELEAKVHELGTATPAAAPAEAEAGPVDEVEEEKLQWQVGFLKTRVAALEERLVQAEAESAPSAAAEPDKAADEELARLRWRNRYLEGRLAYFEEAPAEQAADDTSVETAQSPVAEEAAPEIVPEEVATAIVEDTAPAANDAEEEHPSEGMLRALDASESSNEAAEADAAPEEEVVTEDVDAPIEGEAPTILDKPDGAADDLTLITGVGPRIQSILNDLGIWHFSQIAGWSAENEIWVDDQLNFAGRVGREGWVEQAKELVAANTKAN